jgi:hypothetical protein
MLADHLWLPEGVKETKFFDLHYAKGLKWYAAHFTHCPLDKKIAEIAPTYFHSSEARLRIRRTLPECKIICTLRDPVERLFSLYRLMLQYGMTRLPFEDALEQQPEMMESSRYAFNVAGWLELFGSENVRVMFHQDLEADPKSYIAEVCAFVGIPLFTPAAAALRVNEAGRAARNYHLARLGQNLADWLRAHQLYPVLNIAKSIGLREVFFGNGQVVQRLNAATAARLRERLTPEVERLEILVGRNLSSWKAATTPQGATQPS